MRDDEREPGPRRARAVPAPQAAGLFDRLRAALGLGAPSIRDDIEDALEDTGSNAVFSMQERAMMRNVLGLHELRVEAIMVPRADVVAVGSSMTLGDVLEVFRDVGHSRLPVHGDTLDDPRGMLHIRDFVEVLADQIPGAAAGADRRPAAAVSLSTPLGKADIVRPVLFVPPSMQALDLLVKMQASRTHMALVIDEYGGTDGLVTIEDIVEMIVGDIEDEHDEDEDALIQMEADGTFVADGRAALDDVSAAVGVDLTRGGDAEEIDTIGGLVTSICGRLPLQGEVVSGHDDVDFTVIEADPRRVRRLRIRLLGREGATAEAATPAAPDLAAVPSRTDEEADTAAARRSGSA